MTRPAHRRRGRAAQGVPAFGAAGAGGRRRGAPAHGARLYAWRTTASWWAASAQRIPQASINTDIIVGFPGETAAQFEQHPGPGARDALRHGARGRLFARARARPPAGWPDDVPPEEKERRRRAVEDLQERSSARSTPSCWAQVVEVLVDGQQKGRWRGRTRTNKLVFFEQPGRLAGPPGAGAHHLDRPLVAAGSGGAPEVGEWPGGHGLEIIGVWVCDSSSSAAAMREPVRRCAPKSWSRAPRLSWW